MKIISMPCLQPAILKRDNRSQIILIIVQNAGGSISYGEAGKLIGDLREEGWRKN